MRILRAPRWHARLRSRSDRVALASSITDEIKCC